MNADLENALLEVQAYFLEAKIYANVVEFTAPNLSADDLVNISHITRKNSSLKPWVFRSDKEVRVVFFIKDDNGVYLTSPISESELIEMNTTDTELTSEIEEIIVSELSSREWSVSVDSIRKAAERISDYVKHGSPSPGSEK